MTSAVADPRAAIPYKVALSALAGFVDVGVSALVLARWAPNTALAWAMLAATLSGIGYVAVHLFAQRRATCADGADGGDGLADRLDRLAEEIEDRPADNPDPLLVRWLWNVAISLGWVAFSVGAVLLSYPRTLLTVAVFAVMTSASLWVVAGAIVISIGIQFTVVAGLLEPSAAKRGLTL